MTFEKLVHILLKHLLDYLQEKQQHATQNNVPRRKLRH